MKTVKKTIAVLLALCMFSFVFFTPALAVTAYSENGYSVSEKIGHIFYRFADRLITLLAKALNMFIPGLNWSGRIKSLRDYDPETALMGESVFDTRVAENAQWSMGFADASLLQGLDLSDGNYYLAGSLEVMEGRTPTEVIDDQTVNTYAISDGVSGTVVHVVLDGYGIARGDVLTLRRRLSDFAEQNGIIAINVSVLHQHSCIDTLGLSAPLLPALVKNPLQTLTVGDDATSLSGRNVRFMEHLFTVSADTVMRAVESMQSGKLYYGSADVSEYIHDKREPIVYDGDIHRIRFVPDNASANEIWVCEAGIHCVSFGAAPDVLSSDFPYYLKQFIKHQTGADVVFVEGAELAITSDYSSLSYNDSVPEERLAAFGAALGNKLLSISNERDLPPVLNIKLQEMTVNADNEVLILAVREGLINSVVARDGFGYKLITEIGYIELGNTLGILLAPGELAPEIIWGGAAGADASWTGEAWNYPALADICGAPKLICFGLTNDQIGYVICDNDVRSYLTENEEIVASSFTAASSLVESFTDLINSV